MANIILREQTLRAAVLGREVPVLLHFTQAANLPTIMSYGIVPIASAPFFGLQPHIDDQLRLDDCTDASSVSIGFPNAPMFYKYRQQSVGSDWVVLEIDPAVLWLKPSLFCAQNAASAPMRQQSRDERASVEAFEAMYAPVVGKHMRFAQALRRCDPTDVQAEVLVADVIEPCFIRAAVFADVALQSRYWSITRCIATRLEQHNSGYFSQRGYTRARGFF